MTDNAQMRESAQEEQKPAAKQSDDELERLRARVAELEADQQRVSDLVNNAWADGKNEGHGDATAEASVVIGGLRKRVAELEAERDEREKQEPVAWYIDGEDGREYNGTPKMSGGRIGTPLYAAPPVITQHEPVTTVEDRYNADGKSCHITDDLPAGMKLYADPPVAAPVRPNDSELEMIARAHGTGGWQTLGDMVTFARAIESAVLRANGFKLEGEQ